MKSKEQDKKAPSAFSGVDSLFGKMPDPKKEPEKTDGKEDVLLAVEALHEYDNHPFGVRDDEDMQELVASIKLNGLMDRIKVQPRQGGGYEILSGHRRFMALKKLGKKEIPVTILRNLSELDAVRLMVDSNLHRPKIYPMERAKSIKMKMDARNRQGQKDGGKKKRTDEEIAAEMGISRATVQRYVRLLSLTKQLQDMVDEGSLSEHPGYEISFLSLGEQAAFYDYLLKEDRKPTKAQALALKEHSQKLKDSKDKSRDLTPSEIVRIMDGERLEHILPLPELPKDQQAETKEVAEPQAPAGGQPVPPAAAEPAQAQGDKPLPPVPFPNTEPHKKENEPATGQPGENKPVGDTANSTDNIPEKEVENAVPFVALTQQQQRQQPDSATVSYIQTRHLAELREKNVIIPKGEIDKHLPSCKTNSEYVAAISAILAETAKKDLTAALDNNATVKSPPSVKTTEPPKPSTQAKPVEPPKTTEPPKPSTQAKPVEPPKATEPPKPGAQAKPVEPPKATEPTKPGTQAKPVEPPKAVEPPKPGAQAKPVEPPKATEPPKPGTQAKPVEPPKATEPPKPSAQAKPVEPPKAAEPPKPSAQAKPVEPQKAAEPPKPGTQTKPFEPTKPDKLPVAKMEKTPMESFLENKAKPGKGKAPAQKQPGLKR